jgi:death on curing protein
MRPQLGYYDGLFEESAALLESLAMNHPFVDGNKRVAVAVAELFLLLNQHELIAADESVEDLAMGTAEGRYAKAQVVEFFARHVERIRGGAA